MRTARRGDADEKKATTPLELIWAFCARIEDDSAVVAAVTDQMRQSCMQDGDGLWNTGG